MSQEPTAPGGALSVPASPKESIYDERDRLVILTPCYGHQLTEQFAQSAIAVLNGAPTARFRLEDGSVHSLPIVATLITQPGESHIDRARNTLLWQAMQTHYRHFLWADADQPFEPHHIALTWARLMSGVRVLGGSVALKTIVTTFAANLEHGKTHRDRDPQGLLPGRDTGTGWMGFKRDVIDEVIARWPTYVRERLAAAINYRPDDALVTRALDALSACGLSADIDFVSQSNSSTAGKTLHAVFASGIAYREGARDWLSEDWMFCHRCLLLGIPIKVDPAIRIKHLGPMLYPPDPAELVQAAVQVVSGEKPPFDKRLAAEAHAALERLHHSITDDSITILHATRGRPEQALRIRGLWLSRASNPKGIEYIFGVDEGDLGAATLNASLTHKCDNFPRVPSVVTIARQSAIPNPQSLISAAPGKGVVAAINTAAASAKGRILIMAADDCEPPQDWDVQIREALSGQLHLPRLLWTSDGYTDQPVCTHPIITRALYEQQGYFFCPEYPHLFCDTELSHRAMAAGQVIDGRHIVLKHQHPMFTGMKPDALHLERNSAQARATGLAIFKKRNPGVSHPHVV